MTQVIKSSGTFQLKGSLFTLTVLELYQANLATFSDQLKSKVQQAPLFFRSTPIVIDLEQIDEDDTEHLDFHALIRTIREHGLVPVGVRGGNSELQTMALSAGLGIMPKDKKNASQVTSTQKPQTHEVKQTFQPTRVITKPIRSGQQIYAQGGDLLILAAVSTGAEVIADGHIHVHGPLRGRALAGVSGNTAARIFCDSLEAELVSIAGFYKVSENLKDTLWQQRTHIFLDDKTLKLEKLDAN